MHGNMGEGGNYSTMGAEVYGNRITGPSGQSIGVIDQRGGKAMVWDNVVYTSSAYAKVREEVWDDYNPTINEQPQHVSDSYYWDNWKNETDFITFYTGNICGTTVVSSTPNCSDKVHGYSLNEDDEWFRHKADFDGSSGIGTGTYAEMTAISPTTIGVGFWCTDRGGNWHKTNETENDGCLYTWNGNSWEVKYVPYAYPHPLRKPQPPDPRIP